MDNCNCDRGSAIRTSNGHDMLLHTYVRACVAADVLLIERTSIKNEIYFHVYLKSHDLIVIF